MTPYREPKEEKDSVFPQGAYESKQTELRDTGRILKMEETVFLQILLMKLFFKVSL